MANHDDNSSSSDELPADTMLAVECQRCGAPVRYSGTGRPPRWCSNACRQHAWALRQVQEPQTAEEWEHLLHVLAEQLADDSHRVAQDRHHHHRLYRSLLAVMHGLDVDETE